MKTYWPVFRPSGLVLAAAMLVPHLAGAQAAKLATPLASPAASVAQIGVERVGQQTVVRMQGSGELSYHVTRMSDPPRVVVDFDEARLAVPSNTVASDYAPVRRVRLGQSRPDQVRVVIDLLNRAEFSVERKDQALTVSFSTISLARKRIRNRRSSSPLRNRIGPKRKRPRERPLTRRTSACPRL